MAAPDFLSASLFAYYYLQTTGMTDVNTIISDVRNVLVTQLGWTEPSTALFKSPPDSAGKFTDILLTRISATNLEFRQRDYRGSTLITRRIQIDATASVNYFGSTRSLAVESLRATPEIFWGGLMDSSPSALADADNRVFGTAYRSSADSQDSQGNTTGGTFCFDNGVAGFLSRMQCPSMRLDGTSLASKTVALTLLYRDLYMYITQTTRKWTGRPYHAVFVDSSIAFATDKVVPLDDAGNNGTFRVIGYATSNNSRIALRKS